MSDDLSIALRHVRASGFQVGEAWTAAHEIAQAHEGERLFDALHALLHRIEGDDWNAGYWDRRAGTDLKGDGPEAELEALERLAEGEPGASAARREG